MRKYKILIFLTVLSLLGFPIVSCDDNMPQVKEVGVESITLSEELSSGVTIEMGETVDISWKVTVFPENATDRAESFYSSDVEVATVNAKGRLTGNAPGTSEITISVGGKNVSFTLTVLEKIIIPATEITLTISELDLMVGVSYNMFAQMKILPLEANDGIDYISSDPAVVSVSSEGMLTGISDGTATITASSKHDASINVKLQVKVVTFSGDYPRAGWTMTASHELFIATNNPEKNSLSSALDGDLTTNFCMVRPGKSFGNTPAVSVNLGEAIYFIVDMQKSQEVNYFRIRHRDITQAFIRWYGFDEISGSNDGVNFEIIGTNVAITEAGIASQQETSNIAIPKSTYRYLKFYAKSANCFYQSSFTSQGSSVQIQELYLGLNP